MFDEPVTDVWLEIGFGGGEHLAAQARANGQIGMLGAEPYINGIAKLLSTIDREALANIRIHPDDARELLEQLPDQSLGAVFILFPDPWPKARHNKRRFINADNLAQIARVLRPGGRLRFASDITDYVRWTLVHVRAARCFEWTAGRAADWRQRPGDWPATRYEAKAIRQGREPSYLQFIRL
ncbi:MAG: tRNA (guanosine(46)-N7)-methyltransferase TrmB [Hyphomicrobiales bacterium]